MKLSIIIVDYNSSSYLKECLATLKKFPPADPYEILIVDNASPENHLAEYEEIHPNVKTFRLEKNIGFGGANNFGAQKAQGEYLFLLNPDTLAVDNSIDKMIGFFGNHPEIGALTCLLYNDEKTLQKHFFGRFQSFGALLFRHYNYRAIDPAEEFFYTDIVTGAAFMIKRELFLKIGGFDQNIFMYFEDDDLCRRLVQKGFKNAVLNTAKIIHLEGKSTTSRTRKAYYYKSQNYYWEKHNGKFMALFMRMLRWPIKIINLWLR